MLIVLVLALVAVTVMAVIGTLPLWSVAIPALVLVGFRHLAHRAAAAEANRPPVRRRQPETVDATSQIAVAEEPESDEPIDPHAWEPVPVPLPTYLTKDRAPGNAIRTIDLTQPGAWTSGRLEQAGPITPPRPVPVPQPAEEDVEELPEHRRAVGD